MNVKEYIDLLLQMPQETEVVSLVDEFGEYIPASVPKLQKIRLRYSQILREKLWDNANFVEDDEMLEEKTVVVV